MTEKPRQHYVSLKPSEKAIFESASRIYAAYIASGQRNDANKADLIRRSIQEAIELASVVEDQVQSDDELGKIA